MKTNQLKFIDFLIKFAEKNKTHIWLGGSFLNGNSTKYSDVDISVFSDYESIEKLIYGYGKPAYISYTHKPMGIIIIIYEDGVAVDLEVVERFDFEADNYFHRENIKKYNYVRDENLCLKVVSKNDEAYQVSRQFHRSLIKFLVGKKDVAMRTINDVATFCSSKEVEEQLYKQGVIELLKEFNKQHSVSKEFYNVLCDLIREIKE